ncbi:MAG: NAD-dependent epimerase/dehydratase family protein [Sphingobium sp.]|nr:NAD-dependent epimerase/dehydratase family protein [Sphingobium sp.]
MARILVTGATGFLGSYVYAFLKDAGHEVYGTTKSRPDGNIIYCNIEDRSSVKFMVRSVNPDIIVHCAAISSVTSSSGKEYYLSNTIGTENILKATEECKGRVRFVFISTAGVYGNQDSDCLSEKLCPRPVHHYGMSKFCAERLVINYSEFIDYTIIRPFNIIGYGQNKEFIVPKLACAFSRRDPSIKLGNIDVYRDYIDISEATNIINCIIFSEKSYGETVNMCTGIPISLKELLSIFKSLTGHDIKIEIAPEFLRKNEVWRLIGDATKLNNIIDGTISSLSIEDSIKNIISAYENK